MAQKRRTRKRRRRCEPPDNLPHPSFSGKDARLVLKKSPEASLLKLTTAKKKLVGLGQLPAQSDRIGTALQIPSETQALKG